MQNKNLFLAFDFGAESSRAVCGRLSLNKLQLQEINRFRTGMISLDDHFYWNIFRFYEEMLNSLASCAKENLHPCSVAIDTWGVDFGFLAGDGSLLRLPYAYRDPQVTPAMADFHKNIPPEHIYALTGISMQPFNSLYHLHAMKLSDDPVFHMGRRLMFIPDLLNYFLSGVKKTEFSFATTSQLYNPFKCDWEKELLDAVGLGAGVMNEIVAPGQVLGGLKEDVCTQTGLRNVSLAAVCSHDTGSAIAAVPAEGDEWAYISSGTWSLMGLETVSPILDDRAYRYNFSNEGGAEGRFRFLKNIMGLWLLQQCRKKWSDSGNEYGYPELIEMAAASKPFEVLLDPDHKGFFNPPDMTLAIDEFCLATSQEKPSSMGGYVRAIFESLALKYRLVLDQLIETTGKNINTVHIIGGGSRNRLLCQFTANATGRKVVAGPPEATAAGNILIQAMANGRIGSIEEARYIMRNSFELDYYAPREHSGWEHAYGRFRQLAGR